jgi:hypothetical protein
MGRGKFQGKIIIHGDNIFEGSGGKMPLSAHLGCVESSLRIGGFSIPKDEVVSQLKHYRIQTIICIIY